MEISFSFTKVLAAWKGAQASYKGHGIVVFLPTGSVAASVTEVCAV